MLASIIQLLTSAVTFIGGAIAVFGMIQLGLAIKDGATGGGGQIAGAVAMIAGGAIVAVAGLMFGQLDISWAR